MLLLLLHSPRETERESKRRRRQENAAELGHDWQRSTLFFSENQTSGQKYQSAFYCHKARFSSEN